MLCNLLSKIARAAVDDQILCALFILVKFDEVVAAAKRAKRALHTTLPLKPLASIHSEVGQRACGIAVNLEAGWHGTLNISIELDKVRTIDTLGKLDAEHPAADVHAHQIGNHFIVQLSGKPDNASFAPVRVRHNADLRALERRTCRNLVDLLLRGILYVLGKNLYLGHMLSFPMPNALQSV